MKMDTMMNEADVEVMDAEFTGSALVPMSEAKALVARKVSSEVTKALKKAQRELEARLEAEKKAELAARVALLEDGERYFLGYNDGVTTYGYKGSDRKSYTGQVRLLGVSASKTFNTSWEDAHNWVIAKRDEIKNGNAAAVAASVPANLTLGVLFDKYREEWAVHHEGTPMPDDQVMMFDRLKAHPLLKDVKVTEVRYSTVRAYCVARIKQDGVKPSTLQSEFARINVALERCAEWLEWGDSWIHPLAGARKKLMAAKLIADSKKRKRRLTDEEARLLLEYFDQYLEDQKAGKRKGVQIPMSDVVLVLS